VGLRIAWPWRALVLAAVCLLTGLATASRADAQDPRNAAEQYIRGAMLSSADAGGYRLTNSGQPSDLAASGALNASFVRFAAEPRGSKPIADFLVVMYAFATPQAAQAWSDSLRAAPRCPFMPCRFERTYNVRGADSTIGYYGLTRDNAGNLDVTYGVGLRAGTVYYDLYVFASERIQGFNAVSGAMAENEMFVLANAQNAKISRNGIFVPPTVAAPPPSTNQPGTSAAPATPATPATSTSEPGMPDMLMLVTARVGGVVAREGTVIRAFIDGKECGRASLVFGFTALSVASRDTTAGCGTPGAAIVFRIGDDLASETVSWGLDNFVTPASLNASRPGGGSGLVVRPVLLVNCIAPEGRCSEHDQALWSGNFDAWFDELVQRGLEPSGSLMLDAWVRFRADRGEIFGALARAFLDEQPFTFITSVRFAPASGDPDTYVTIFNFGADRPVGGWTVRSGGAVYAFPPDAVLTKGTCRIYRGEVPASDVSSTCPGAALVGAEAAFGQQGFVDVLDAEGHEIDSVAW
jgi:hypothetical protein